MCLTPLLSTFQLCTWWSVLLVKETGVPGGTHRPAPSHIMLYPVYLPRTGLEPTTLEMIGSDYMGS